MSNPSDALEALATSATHRYIVVAGCAWVLYDWLITLGQEIDLVWRKRSKAWQSKFLYAITRYPGLALVTFNAIVILHTDWSATFCRVYLRITAGIGIVQMCASQAALLLRLYVMYHRSFTVIAISVTFFAIEFVSVVTLWVLDVQHSIPLPIPAPATGCRALSQYPAFTKASWLVCLIFETYTCGLALWSAYSHLKASGTRSPNLLTVLIRDSLLWYICLSVCLFLNALGSLTGTLMLTLIGIPAMQCTATVGGSRFLLNLRAAYFRSTRNTMSTSSGKLQCSAEFTQTEGTVGVFRSFPSNLREESEERERECGGSAEMGLWASDGPGTHDDDRPSSPPAMMLQPGPANRRGQRAPSTQGSSSARLREPGDGEEPGVSALDLSHPVHSPTRLCGQQHEVSDLDAH